MRNIPETLRKAAAVGAQKMEAPQPPEFDLEMLTVSADGPMWDPSQPLQVLAPRMICKDASGETIARIMSLNVYTGDAIQIEGNEDGTHRYDEKGHPILNRVRVSRVEIDIPPR
jgi:hypothetical protein